MFTSVPLYQPLSQLHIKLHHSSYLTMKLLLALYLHLFIPSQLFLIHNFASLLITLCCFSCPLIFLRPFLVIHHISTFIISPPSQLHPLYQCHTTTTTNHYTTTTTFTNNEIHHNSPPPPPPLLLRSGQ